MQSGSHPIKVMLNASHAVAGGGLIYLASILPELARAQGIQWILVAPAETLARLKIPRGWAARAAPRLGFFGVHLWEQTVLPLWARGQGVAVTLCNANYVPLAAPRPVAILHSPVDRGPGAGHDLERPPVLVGAQMDDVAVVAPLFAGPDNRRASH